MRTSILRKQTAQGMFWTAFSHGVNSVLRFVSLVILARLLFPKDFGIVAMASIFTELVMLVRDLGLGCAIVQKKDIDESHLSTAFWANLGASILLWTLMALTSPGIALFFKNGLVGPVVVVSSLGFVINAFGMIHGSLLSKYLNFRKLAVAEVVSSLSYGLLAVLLALNGFGVWSIVLAMLLQRLVNVALLWMLYKWRPAVMFNIKAFKELFGFGVNVVGENIANYGTANVDYLLVGRFLGSTALGIYTMAYQLMTLPLSRVSIIFTRVMFPAFSTIQDDDAKLRKVYIDLVRYLSTITFPIMMGLLIVAPEFIKVIYGAKWIDAIIPLQIMCVAGMLKSVGTTVGSIQYAKGRPDIGFKWNLFTLVVLSVGVALGVTYGVVGVAVAVTAATIFLFPIIQQITNSLIDLRFSQYLRAVYPASAGSAVMAVALLIYRNFTTNVWSLNDFWFLASSIPLGVVTYFVIIALVERRLLTEIKELIAVSVPRRAEESKALGTQGGVVYFAGACRDCRQQNKPKTSLKDGSGS